MNDFDFKYKPATSSKPAIILRLLVSIFSEILQIKFQSCSCSTAFIILIYIAPPLKLHNSVGVAFLTAYQLRYTLDILCCSDSLIPSSADFFRNRVRIVNFVQEIFDKTDRPILVRKLFTNVYSAPSLCWRTSLIDALSSYVKWRYTVFPIVFPVKLGCFHLFYPITKLFKIFARNLHMLLRIDYISTCVIHFKCTLLLEDIISWHLGGRLFLAHPVHSKRKRRQRQTGRQTYKMYNTENREQCRLGLIIIGRRRQVSQIAQFCLETWPGFYTPLDSMYTLYTLYTPVCTGECCRHML